MNGHLKLAAYAGIAWLASSILFLLITVIFSFSVLSSSVGEGSVNDILINPTFLIIIAVSTLIILVLSSIFYSGFITLGKKYGRPYLVITAWIIIISTVIFGIISIISTIDTLNSPPDSQNILIESSNTISINDGSFIDEFKHKIVRENPFFKYILEFFGVLSFWIILAIMALASLLVKILFGSSLITLDAEGVPLAKLSGIFELVIILLSWLSFVAIILEVIMFFKIANNTKSKKPDKRTSPKTSTS